MKGVGGGVASGWRHVYIRPRSLQLNRKVERSHKADEMVFYQLLMYTDDVDLNERLLKQPCREIPFSRIGEDGHDKFAGTIRPLCYF